MLRSGELDRRIIIREMKDTTDEYGTPGESPVNFATVWARKDELRGRELYQAQQISGEITTKWTTRYRVGITRKHSILDTETDIAYDIYSISEIGRREGLEILAKARAQ